MARRWRSKVDSVILRLSTADFLKTLDHDKPGEYRVKARNSGDTAILKDNDAASALWLLDHFARGVTVDANLDSFEFIQPQRWRVRVSVCVDFYGSGIGRTFEEAVFRAFWHMLYVKKPAPEWLVEAREHLDTEEML